MTPEEAYRRAYAEHAEMKLADGENLTPQERYQLEERQRRLNGEKGADTSANRPNEPEADVPDSKQRGDSAETSQSRVPKPGDSDFVGPIPSGSWRLVPDGEGAHLVERSNIKGRDDWQYMIDLKHRDIIQAVHLKVQDKPI